MYKIRSDSWAPWGQKNTRDFTPYKKNSNLNNKQQKNVLNNQLKQYWGVYPGGQQTKPLNTVQWTQSSPSNFADEIQRNVIPYEKDNETKLADYWYNIVETAASSSGGRWTMNDFLMDENNRHSLYLKIYELFNSLDKGEPVARGMTMNGIYNEWVKAKTLNPTITFIKWMDTQLDNNQEAQQDLINALNGIVRGSSTKELTESQKNQFFPIPPNDIKIEKVNLLYQQMN